MPTKRSDGRTYQRTRRLPDGSTVKSGPYWIEYYDAEGKQQREPTKLFDFKAADAIRFQRIGEKRSGVLVTPQTGRVTVGELLDDLLIEVKQRGQNESLATIHCNHLRRHFGQMIAGKIGTDQLQAYISLRLQKGVCGGTINRELTRLRRAFQLAADREPPKVLRVPKIRKLAENEARSGFLEREDYERLRMELPEELRPVLSFAYYSGCRAGEVLSLRWEQVDVTAGIVRLRARDTKGKQPRTFSMPTDLLEMMRLLAEQRAQNWPEVSNVFTRRGRPIRDFHGAWDAATQRAGMPDTLFHDLRRTGVRNMVRAGVPEAVAMRISGHRTRSVFERYNIVSERDMIEAARKIQAHQDAEIQRIKDKTRTTAPENRTTTH